MTSVLIVKTSSLGDVVHALPAVSDIRRHHPALRLHWMVEESFAAIPALHPAIESVFPVAVRRWRRSWNHSATWHEMHDVREKIRSGPWELCLDLQGLLKSALLSRLAGVPVAGYTRASAREPLASLFYHRRFAVPWSMHAVERNRSLAGQALGFTPESGPDYGISLALPPTSGNPGKDRQPYAVLLHSTSWTTKLWPESNWINLGNRLLARGWLSILPAGTTLERTRAERLAQAIPAAQTTPPLSLRQVAEVLQGAACVIGVDTGLVHLAAALGRPVVALYTATSPEATGVYAQRRVRNCGGLGLVPSVQEVEQALDSIWSGEPGPICPPPPLSSDNFTISTSP